MVGHALLIQTEVDPGRDSEALAVPLTQAAAFSVAGLVRGDQRFTIGAPVTLNEAQRPFSGAPGQFVLLDLPSAHALGHQWARAARMTP